jgi:hypothetical protein
MKIYKSFILPLNYTVSPTSYFFAEYQSMAIQTPWNTQFFSLVQRTSGMGAILPPFIREMSVERKWLSSVGQLVIVQFYMLIVRYHHPIFIPFIYYFPLKSVLALGDSLKSSFIHSLSQYLLKNYWVHDTVLAGGGMGIKEWESTVFALKVFMVRDVGGGIYMLKSLIL